MATELCTDFQCRDDFGSHCAHRSYRIFVEANVEVFGVHPSGVEPWKPVGILAQAEWTGRTFRGI
jgi:hypothetical protein